jgi:predicted nuclease with RNAse H fold
MVNNPVGHSDTCLIVGIDCATDPRKTGVARAEFAHGRVRILDAFTCSRKRLAVDVAAEWLIDRHSAIVALDAPLGWPTALGASLTQHVAGAPIIASADALFSRDTDRDIHRRLGKRPLEVGANLIARTAVAALGMLATLRERLGVDIPLGWTHGAPTGIVAIEVYPAATSRSHGISCDGSRLVGLPAWVTIPSEFAATFSSDHARDAVLCAIAGADFCAGRAKGPGDLDCAQREGWIWAASRQSLEPL